MTLSRLDEPDTISRELRKLSPKLETLCLEFPEAEKCLLKDFDDSLLVDIFENDAISHSSAESNTERCEREVKSPFWSLTEHFPHLTSLSLSGTHPQLEDSHVIDLPRTLTKFSQCSYSKLTRKCLASLPNNLLILLLPTLALDFKSTSEFPRGLLKLRVGTISSDSLTNLPPGLESFVGLTHMQCHHPFLQDLPRTIRKLADCTGPMSPEDMQTLPLLTELRLLSVPDLTPELVALLPRTLNHLFLLAGNHKLADIQSHHWPPYLKSMDIFAQIQLSSTSITSLPLSITELTLNNLVFSDLETPLASTQNPAEPTNQSLLPLEPSFLPDSDLPTPKSSSWDLFFTFFSRLRLKKLHVGVVRKFNCDRASPLPTCLQELRIRGDVLWTSKFLNSLPRALTKLAIDLPRDDRWDISQLSSLPKTLFNLQLNIDPDCAIDSTVVVTLLLRNLQVLSLNRPGTPVTTASIFALPPQLKNLSLLNSLLLRPDECVKALPRTLTSLEMEVENWRGYLVADLPRGLRTFMSTRGYPHLQDKDIPMLPRTLTSFYMGRETSISAEMSKFLPPFLTTGFDLGPAWRARQNFIQQKRSFPVVTPDPRVVTRSDPLS